MSHPAAPNMTHFRADDPMYQGLSKEEYNELNLYVESITHHMASLDPNASTKVRVEWFLDLVQICYMHQLCMLRLPDLRRAIITYFETFFVELASGNLNVQISLDLRDQLNRMYGMMLESNRNLLHNPLWLD